MESYDVKNNSSVVTLCNKKDVGTMKKKIKERERETKKLLSSFLCLLLSGIPANPIAS